MRAHVDLAAARAHLAGGRVPHHAGTLAGILEAFDQRLDDLAVALAAGPSLAGSSELRSALRHRAPSGRGP